jgi:hypothetical protein
LSAQQAPLTDVAVVYETQFEPGLEAALESLYHQNFKGSVQLLLGVERALAAPREIKAILQAAPRHIAVDVIDLGYPTQRRFGGVHRGGALRTVLSLAARSRRVTYMDDATVLFPGHLAGLIDALGSHAWAWTRWYDDYQTEHLDGQYLPPAALMIDKIICQPVLHFWTFGEQQGSRERPEGYLATALRKHFPDCAETSRGSMRWMGLLPPATR